MHNIEEALNDITKRILQAEKRSEFKQRVKLVAVTKTQPAEVLQKAHSLGLNIFGENRVQELLTKKPTLPKDIEWHLIGPLQTNKVKSVLKHVELIHSLDRPSLADELDKRAEQMELSAKTLIEVNVAKENSKHGLLPEEIHDFLDYLAYKNHLKIEGFMTVAPIAENPEEVRWVFKSLRQLFMKIKEQKLPNVNMKWLSMGMTNDFEVAIEEGANLVRIGSGIFGAR